MKADINMLKKTSLFVRILAAFIVSLLLFSGILIISYSMGFSGAVSAWESSSLQSIKDNAVDFLRNPEKVNKAVMPQDVPVFIYNKQKNLQYSNRGIGKQHILDEKLIPLYLENEEIGFLITSQRHFLDNKANQRFAQALTRAVILALVISLIVVSIWAVIIARSISRPSMIIASGIEKLSEGRLGTIIPEKGTSEIRKIAAAVNNLSRQLVKEKELRTQWTRDIAHDLRTPVAALKAQSEGMLHGALDITKDRVNKNMKEIYRMENLVEDLSELMKLEEPKLKISPQEIITVDFINQIISRCHDEIADKKIKVEIRNKLPLFQGDERLLNRAMANIWSNAVRHTQYGGKITIDVYKKSSLIIIKVHNTGDIIPKNELNRIFDRLFRGEQSRNTPGSGLGLTITRKIVELHHGRIYAQTKETAGTEFIIELPVDFN